MTDLSTWIRLIGATLVPIALSALFSFLDRKPKFQKLGYWKKQILIGLCFGGYAVLSTEFGVPIDEGALMNVRDAAPLCAGLIFGMPAGIIAGVIGGVERWFCVYWGGGIYTRLACSLATVLAGFFAGIMRKRLFENQKPPFGYGLGIGMTMEVLHMLLVLLTNINDMSHAFVFVEKCGVPMILANGIAVALAIIASGYVRREEIFHQKPPFLSYDFGFRLFVCMAIAFYCTSYFSYKINDQLARNDASELLQLNLHDITSNIQITSLDKTLDYSPYFRIGQTGGIIIADKDKTVMNPNFSMDSLKELAIFSGKETPQVRTCYVTKIKDSESYCMFTSYAGHYILAYIPVKEANFFQNASLYMTIFMEILIYTALFILLYELIKKKMVQNLHLVNDGLHAITNGDLDRIIDVHSHQEFVMLSEDINTTVDTLKKYIKEAEERIDKELEMARQIQHSALPSVFPPFPERKDFDLYASMDAAKEVGGDFYDFYLLNPSTLIILIADVSGKGIPAAMFMMTAKSLIKSLVESGLEIEEAFTKANQKLCANNDADMFVTAWMGKLDLQTGQLSYVNAGHNPPLIRHKDGAFEYLRTRPNFVLAGMDITKYRCNELTLCPGDMIYLYTDGVTEAANPEELLYGEERLQSIADSYKGTNPKELCDLLKQDVLSFTDGAAQSDDITMLAAAFYACRDKEQISVFPSTDAAELLTEFIDEKMEAWGISEKVSNRIHIAADEIYSNIFHHSQARKMTLAIRKTENMLQLTFRDNGIPFDPTKKSAPDVTLPGIERVPGGLGIFMVQKLASSVEYKHQDDENILKLEFFIE